MKTSPEKKAAPEKLPHFELWCLAMLLTAQAIERIAGALNISPEEAHFLMGRFFLTTNMNCCRGIYSAPDYFNTFFNDLRVMAVEILDLLDTHKQPIVVPLHMVPGSTWYDKEVHQQVEELYQQYLPILRANSRRTKKRQPLSQETQP